MRTRALLLMAVLTLPIETGTGAQIAKDSIDVGATTLRLGDAQGSVLQQLGGYALQGNENNNDKSATWMVVSKTDSRVAFANIYFKNGKLAAVNKYWDIDEPSTAVGFADALFGAITEFEREGRTDCQIQTERTQNPGNEIKTAFVVCGQKHLRIDIFFKGQQGESATITEVLESPEIVK